jgi:hypothetical protein
MLNCTDCDVRVASHARQIARVNATEWMHPTHTRAARISLRSRLGGVFISLGTRLVRTPAGASVASPLPEQVCLMECIP